MNLTYPGPVILGLPQFNIDLPEDWRLTDDPDLLMVAGTSEPHNGFRNNVTINGGRAPRPIEPVQIAERSRESGIDGADSAYGTRRPASGARHGGCHLGQRNGIVSSPACSRR